MDERKQGSKDARKKEIKERKKADRLTLPSERNGVRPHMLERQSTCVMPANQITAHPHITHAHAHLGAQVLV